MGLCGGGVAGGQHLLYLGERHPRTFQRLLNKEEGTRSEWEYPFAVGGVNISFMLTEMLQLRKQPEVRCLALLWAVMLSFRFRSPWGKLGA